MKTRVYFFVYLGLFCFSFIITAVIDHIIGVSFKDVSAVVQFTHKVTYMLCGLFIGMSKWLR